jgi:hypothetical protein
MAIGPHRSPMQEVNMRVNLTMAWKAQQKRGRPRLDASLDMDAAIYHDAGFSYAQIAKQLHVSKSSAYRMVKRVLG